MARLNIGDRVRSTSPIPGVRVDIIGVEGIIIDNDGVDYYYVRFDNGDSWYVGDSEVAPKPLVVASWPLPLDRPRRNLSTGYFASPAKKALTRSRDWL